MIVKKQLKATNIKTLHYPGFPTDLQQPFVTLLTSAKGVSHVEETIYENRFMNIPYLNKMGANIQVKDTICNHSWTNKIKRTRSKSN